MVDGWLAFPTDITIPSLTPQLAVSGCLAHRYELQLNIRLQILIVQCYIKNIGSLHHAFQGKWYNFKEITLTFIRRIVMAVVNTSLKTFHERLVINYDHEFIFNQLDSLMTFCLLFISLIKYEINYIFVLKKIQCSARVVCVFISTVS